MVDLQSTRVTWERLYGLVTRMSRWGTSTGSQGAHVWPLNSSTTKHQLLSRLTLGVLVQSFLWTEEQCSPKETLASRRPHLIKTNDERRRII